MCHGPFASAYGFYVILKFLFAVLSAYEIYKK